MRKGLITVLVIAMILLTLSSCGGKNEEDIVYDSLESEKGNKLSIMIPGHNPNDENQWQNIVIEEFKQEYPDVEVEFVVAGWDGWMTRVLSSISANDPIDVINDGANNNPMFAMRGITQPLNDYIDLENPNLHINTMDEVFKYNDKYYVAATETNVCVIFYNKTMFQNAGIADPMELYEKGEWTFDTFIEVAKQLTDTSGEKKQWGFATNYPYIFLGSNQTSILKLDDNFKYELNINDPAVRRVLEMVGDGWHNSGWYGWEGDPWSTFYKGEAAMLGDFQNIDIQMIKARDYGLVDFEYGAAPMPIGPDNKDNVSPITTAGWSMGNGCDTPNHSGKLIDMLVNGQAAEIARQQEILNPAHLALYKELAQRPYCVNSYDSAVGGAFEIFQDVVAGVGVTQAIAEYTPVYQRMIDEANSAYE